MGDRPRFHLPLAPTAVASSEPTVAQGTRSLRAWLELANALKASPMLHAEIVADPALLRRFGFDGSEQELRAIAESITGLRSDAK